MNFAVIDIVFASVMLLLVVRCALKGFVDEFLSMAALVAGGFCAFFFLKPAAVLLRDKAGLTVLPELVAGAALFLLGFLAVKLLERVLSEIIEKINLTGVDRALGAVLGLAEGVLVVSAVLLAISLQPLFDSTDLLKDSFFAKHLMQFATLAGQGAAAAVKGR